MHSGAKKRLQEPSRSQRPGAQAAVCQLLFRPKRSKPPKVPAQGGQFLQPPPPAAAAFATATATAPTLRLGLFLPRFYSYCIPLLLLSNYSSCCCYHAYNYEYAYSHGANTPTTGLQPRLPLLPLCFKLLLLPVPLQPCCRCLHSLPLFRTLIALTGASQFVWKRKS